MSAAARPLLGAIATSAAGLRALEGGLATSWSRALGWTDDAAWWSLPGVALHAPEGRARDAAGDHEAAFAVRGNVVGSGRRDPPAGWDGPPAATDGATHLLYDLLQGAPEALRRIRGGFAVALWDGRRECLTLARDPLGLRSLFHRRHAGCLIFCSDLECLLALPGTETQLDHESAFWYLAFGMSRPGGTLAAGVDRLPAAHLLRVVPGTPVREQRYWSPLDTTAPEKVSDAWLEVADGLLAGATERYLAGRDRPALLLSGGMDSTYLGRVAKELRAENLLALTVQFDPGHGMNETEYSSAVAEWLGLELVPVTVRPDMALEVLHDTVLPAADPCAAWASISIELMLRAARTHGVDGLLSGLGADEVFGGYDHFRGAFTRFLRWSRATPRPPGLDAFDAVLLDGSPRARRTLFPGVARFLDDSALRKGLHEPYSRWRYSDRLAAFYRECRRLKPGAHYMEMMVAHECQFRIPDILFANFEPLARRRGFETGYPFLDPDLVRLVAGLRIEDRYRTTEGNFSLHLRDLDPRFKHCMVRLAEGRIPQPIIDRPRKSLTAPFGGWLFDEAFSRPVLAGLSASRFWDVGIVRREWLNVVLSGVVPGPNRWVFQLWALVTLAGWYDRYVESPRTKGGEGVG